MRPDWDANAGAFAAGILYKHLISLKAEIDGVRLGLDIEYIHRMRVASRRFRNALDIFSFCFNDKLVQNWQKQAGMITSSLGAARDKDVQMESVQKLMYQVEDRRLNPGLKRLLLRLQQERNKLQQKLFKSLERLETSGELEIMDQRLSEMMVDIPDQTLYSTALYRLAWESILQRLQDMKSYEIFIEDINNAEELHAMRIMAKKLRYSIEIFSPLYQGELKTYLHTTRQIQDFLGDIHDCEVWLAYLPEFVKSEEKRIVDFYGAPRGFRSLETGINYFIQNRQEKRNNLYNEFKIAWLNWQQQDIWQKLIIEIKTPLFY